MSHHLTQHMADILPHKAAPSPHEDAMHAQSDKPASDYQPSMSVRKLYKPGMHFEYLTEYGWHQQKDGQWLLGNVCMGSELTALTCQVAFMCIDYQSINQSDIVHLVLADWTVHPTYVMNGVTMYSHGTSRPYTLAQAVLMHRLVVEALSQVERPKMVAYELLIGQTMGLFELMVEQSSRVDQAVSDLHIQLSQSGG